MRVILTTTSLPQRNRLQKRVETLSPLASVKVATNLTEAYHEAEHSPPRLAVFSEELADLPEFEVISALFDALQTRIAIFRNTKSTKGPASKAVTTGHVVFVREDMDDDALRRALTLTNHLPAMPSIETRSTPTPLAAAVPGRVIMIGSSTGGVEALIKVLSTFSSQSPPTFLVQHTGGSFSAGLARLLDGKSPIRVCEAEDGMTVPSGTAVLAPGDRCHLRLQMRGQSATCRLVEQPEVGGHRPSVDVLFKSGIPHASRIAAAILTGMGRDGAEGLLDLKKAGARTFGQDQATSLVYGMPRVAAQIGAIELQLPLEQIGPALIKASSERTSA